MKNKYRIYDTFNRRVVSNHRSLSAAVTAAAKFSRAVKRNNGQNSYIPTRIEQPDTDGDWLPVPIDEVQDAEQQLFNR
jgi:hypothetical protein